MQAQTELHQMGVNVPDIITLTARLAQLLAEEADHLQEMKISRVGPLQEEKLRILNALERQKKFIDQNPDFLESVDDEDRDELSSVVEIFQMVLAENHRRLLMAREVNLKLVEAIAEAVAEGNGSGTYDENGQPESDDSKPLSITLNQTI